MLYRIRSFLLIALAFAMVGSTVACGPSRQPSKSSQAQSEAQTKARNADVYVPENSLELDNYNDRQKIADDPSTLLWCTVFPTQPGAPINTFPIVGKLTSGSKRPYAVKVDRYGTGTKSWNPELPGPDGMFGSSGEYRYGFTPAGIYVDFYNLETLCTTEPLVIQREQTTFALEVDGDLEDAHARAREALAAGDNEGAQRILQEAIGNLNPPSVPTGGNDQ